MSTWTNGINATPAICTRTSNTIEPGFTTVGFHPPKSGEYLKLRIRCQDAYIVGFCGAGDHWFFLKGDKPADADATKSTELNCGGSYMDLPDVQSANLGSLKGVLILKRFNKGDTFAGEHKQAIVLVAAAVSEALRFATARCGSSP